MELLGLALLMFLARAAVDFAHAVKGTDPPHVEKARLRAQQQKPPRERSPYAEGKPRLKDVAAALWGDAMDDAIAAHNRRRGEKQARLDEKANATRDGREPAKTGPSFKQRARRFWDLLIKPVGEKPRDADGDTASTPGIPGDDSERSFAERLLGDQPVSERGVQRPSRPGVVHDSNEYKLARNYCWECPKCGSVGLDYPTPEVAGAALAKHVCDPRYANPDDRKALRDALARNGQKPVPSTQPAPAPTKAPAPGRCGQCGGRTGRLRRIYDEATGTYETSAVFCPRCDRVGQGVPDRVECQRCGGWGFRVTVRPRTDDGQLDRRRPWRAIVHELTGTVWCPTDAQFREFDNLREADKPGPDEQLRDWLNPTGRKPVPDASTSQASGPMPAPSKGDPMTAPTTGEVANYETAMAALDDQEAKLRAELDAQMAALTSVQAAKSQISDAQTLHRPAVEAAVHTHDALTALHLDQQTVANTGLVADAMSANEVDLEFEHLEAMEARHQQEVASTEAALGGVAQARQVIMEKYGDAHVTVATELAGDSRFLDGGGAATAGYGGGGYDVRPSTRGLSHLNPTEEERQKEDAINSPYGASVNRGTTPVPAAPTPSQQRRDRDAAAPDWHSNAPQVP